jgi:hypothetical protein
MEKNMECSVQSIALNRIVKYYDGQWQGMLAASDGACYFGASTHSPKHGSSLLKFEPETMKITVLAEDMTKICSENLNETPPQGKIHSPIVEFDGWLYFTTHLSNYWESAVNKYTGAHVIGYELSTGNFRDFGIVQKRYTIYSAINVDKINKKLYVFSVPMAKDDIEKDGCHLYQIDIETAEKTDLGLVGQKGSSTSYWFFIDNMGNCWFTLWKNHWPLSYDHGDLYQYDANAKVLNCYKNVLPYGKLAPDGLPAAEKLKTERSWSWLEALPGNKQCLFTMGWLGGGDERLWIFDPSKSIENGDAFQPIAYIGATFLSLAFNNKDRVYFIQYKSLNDSRVHWTEAIRDYQREDIKFNDELHLRSIGTDPNEDNIVIDHGRIVDQDNRRVTMIESLAVDNKNNIYMQGTWDSLSAEESSYQFYWPELAEYYVELGYPGVCKTYNNLKHYEHNLLSRGQFFSFVNISADI